MIDSISLQEEMMMLCCGMMITRCIGAAAHLRLADLLAKGARNVQELAELTGTHPLALQRLLRALVAVGVFRVTHDEHFEQNERSALLCEDHPHSLHAVALLHCDLWAWDSWKSFLQTLEDGRPHFEEVSGGKTLWTYLQENPHAGTLFHKAIAGRIKRVEQALVAAYSFAAYSYVADIGGGTGSLLAAILHAYPIQGILFDRTEVVAQAKATLAAKADRCSFVTGDFFQSVPSGADCYILRQILHDWSDQEASHILRNCARAMPRDGKLLVIEILLNLGEGQTIEKLIDVQISLTQTGRERTLPEYLHLFQSAGLSLIQIIPLPEAYSILELRRDF